MSRLKRKLFDPFDERNRDKRTKRTSEEVEAERKSWEERIDNHFRRAMEELGWPDYVTSDSINAVMWSNPETNLPMEVMRRNFEVAMGRLDYVKMKNPANKRGRWQLDSVFTFVYKGSEMPNLGKDELKQALGAD